ncbi:hypothetical protein [Symbioplanes lichenis]|uniref:hypothetical protein n=1 Tax=Symbioplanes lichenis TaxID=1629072 RepID=UPI002739EDA6|nr:hypothetical protein [Actinoplanes lichenis]
MTRPSPTDRADAELARLERAVTAIAANLVDLDDNSDRKDLDRGPLTGRTAREWADATTALTQLWDGYAMLTAVIKEARALRSQRRFSDRERAEYAHRVLGSSITLSTTTVPLARRGLLGARHSSTTCTPGELLSAMEAAFATAVAVVTEAGEHWHRLMPAAAAAAARVAHLKGLTRSVTLEEADRRLDGFTAALATDPLGCDETTLDAVLFLLEKADAERTSAGELRESLVQRLADAHKLAAGLAGAARTAAAAEHAAGTRFSEHDLVVPGGPDLRPDLVALDALAAAGQWDAMSPRLAAWTRAARERLAALEAATAHNTGLLAQRNELRGRFSAYRAKAAGRGLAEDATLAPLAARVQEVLTTAPCALEEARTAVAAYQEAVTALTRPTEVRP